MTSLFGKITEETPKFEVLKKTDAYEIRKYAPCIIATTTYKVRLKLIGVHSLTFFRVEIMGDLKVLRDIFLAKIPARFDAFLCRRFAHVLKL